MNRPRKRLLTFNDPQPLRIDRRLAMEIGFLESVVLLQLEYLISISNNEREGQFWTYHTLKSLKDRCFPWLSQATICRTLQSLEEKRLIVRAHYNRSGFDRTQWFALNYEGIAELASVRIGEDAPIFHSAIPVLHHATPTLQDETPILQAGATIPKKTTEKTHKNTNNQTAPTPEPHDLGRGEGHDVVVALLGSLTDAGVTKKRAEALIARHTADEIRSQLEMLEYRKADDPAAVLVRAIEEAWAPPVDYRKAGAQRERAERERLSRERQARDEAALIAAQECAKAAQEDWWNGLGEDEQAELNAQAEASLRSKHPLLFSEGGLRKSGVMYQSILDAERRALIEERMAGVENP